MTAGQVEDPLLQVEGVTVAPRVARATRTAHAGEVVVDDVSLTVEPGEIVGLVGESGCGKSTLARTIVGVLSPRRGTVRIGGVDAHRDRRRPAARCAGGSRWCSRTRPARSLPEPSVGASIAEALAIHRIGDRADRARRRRAAHHGGPPARRRATTSPAVERGPGPTRWRSPEPSRSNHSCWSATKSVTALDTVVQATILDLLGRLREELAIGCLFIAHDLAVVARIADRVAVMHVGEIVETGSDRRGVRRPGASPDLRPHSRRFPALPV